MHDDGAKRESGLLISFDGVDSSGKETQAKVLAKKLEEQGFVVHLFETPDYTTESGKKLKLRFQGKLGDWENTPWQEKLRYFAENRAEHLEEVKEALSRGEIVIYDRYIPSSLAFVSIEAEVAGEKDLEQVYGEVEQVEYQDNGMPKENLSIFLDVPPKDADRLLKLRKDEKQEDDEYTDQIEVMERLYDRYEELIKQQPGRIARIACIKDNELMPIDEIHNLVWEQVSKLLK